MVNNGVHVRMQLLFKQGYKNENISGASQRGGPWPA